MSKPAEHQHYDIGVKALIMREEELLMMRRTDYGSWDVPGGRINVGETPESALYREVPEELPGSRVVGIQRLLHAEQTDFTLPNGNCLMLLFYAVDVELPVHVGTSSEHSEVVFVSKETFAGLVPAAPIIQAASQALTIAGFLD